MASMITFIKNFFFNITNFALGKTVFFVVILGWFFVITGLIFLAQPEKARAKLIGQGFGVIKGLSFVCLLYLSLFMLSLAGKVGGVLSTLISLTAIGLPIWAFFYLTNKSLKLIRDKLALVPIPVLKTYALVQIVVGVLMILLHRRIW